MQATVSLFCLWAKRCFSLQTLEGKKIITVAPYYCYVLLLFYSKHKAALFLFLELLGKVG